MNVILSCYKDKTNFPFEVTPETTVGEIKAKLKQLLEQKAENKYTYNEINFLYSSQILDDNKNLSSYNIPNNNIIFYYYTKKKAKGNKADTTNKANNIINKIDSNDSIVIDNNINQKNGENNNEINESLNIYSSIIKILTYYNPSNMRVILDYLNKNNENLFKDIVKSRDSFEDLLKLPISNDDIHFYKENYDKVLDLKKAINNHNNNEINNGNNNKEIIIINEEDDKFIRSCIFKSKKYKKKLDKETIILEYIKNKFNKEKTSLELKEMLYNQ